MGMDSVQAIGIRIELTDAQLVARCRRGDHDAYVSAGGEAAVPQTASASTCGIPLSESDAY
jgi:hypothetical protein